MTLFDLLNMKPEEKKTEATEAKPIFLLSPEEAQQRFQEIMERMHKRAQRPGQKAEQETPDQTTTE